MQVLSSPFDYGLNHEEWRPHQRETIEWAVNHRLGYINILEAPTGVGKTAIARAVATVKDRTIAFVGTKALQRENYGEAYDFTTIYGRENYTCVWEMAHAGATAAQCAFAEEGMNKCPQFSTCPYAQAREEAKVAPRAVLNYAYWTHVWDKWPPASLYVLDECHELPRIVTDWAGIAIDEECSRRWGFPVFPLLMSSNVRTSERDVEQYAFEWLQSCRRVLRGTFTRLSANPERPENRKHIRACELLGKKITATMEALEFSRKDWFIRSGPRAMAGKQGFIAKPLTAKYHFAKLFAASSAQVLLMSATIGSPEVFADELGLAHYQFRSVPHPYAVETRPVHILDVPRLGQKSSAETWDKQADEIAKAIKSLPHHWHGMILTTSIVHAQNLARRLSTRGLQDRVVLPQRMATEKLVEYWQAEMTSGVFEGKILITWALWTGYNGLDENFLIVAKVPWSNLGDDYEIARSVYNPEFTRLENLWMLMQGIGRVRRGRPQDYDTPDHKAKYVAIADGGYKWLRNMMSVDMRQSLVGDK